MYSNKTHVNVMDYLPKLIEKNIESENGERVCRKCGERKPKDQFYKSKQNLIVPCIECQQIFKEWRRFKALKLAYNRKSLAALRNAFFAYVWKRKKDNLTRPDQIRTGNEDSVNNMLYYSEVIDKFTRTEQKSSDRTRPSRRKDVPLRRMRIHKSKVVQSTETQRTEASKKNGGTGMVEGGPGMGN